MSAHKLLPWQAAYARWMALTERGYGRGRHEAKTREAMNRVDARIRAAKAKYETLLAAHKAKQATADVCRLCGGGGCEEGTDTCFTCAAQTACIVGSVSIDRDGQGELFLSAQNIVISDSENNVVCLVPYASDDDDERAKQEQIAKEIVRRLNGA